MPITPQHLHLHRACFISVVSTWILRVSFARECFEVLVFLVFLVFLIFSHVSTEAQNQRARILTNLDETSEPKLAHVPPPHLSCEKRTHNNRRDQGVNNICRACLPPVLQLAPPSTRRRQTTITAVSNGLLMRYVLLPPILYVMFPLRLFFGRICQTERASQQDAPRKQTEVDRRGGLSEIQSNNASAIF